MAAGARRRLLPAWMGAAGDERAAAVPPKAARRRAAARPRAAAAVQHCMNEAELVDVALAVLAENLRCKKGEEKARSGSKEEQKLQPRPKEDPVNTGNVGGGSDCSPALPLGPDAGAGADAERRRRWEDSEDDALKYVREIFFS
ncbi:cell cycle regulator of non-homologous end joining isoform X2 [Athene noctua]|uniref:cell cycle regulator of non-homologous end joining isoform X2 n=1 Tax=Athene noctua TaxID=126797 RepID=UPI003EC080F5